MDAVDEAVGAIRRIGTSDLPDPGFIDSGYQLALPGDTMMKALPMSGVRPEGVQHNMLGASRRYMFAYNGIWEDGTPHLGYNVLRRLGDRNPVLWMVLNTLINQVAEHFVRPQNERAIGIRVVQKDRHKPLTAGAAKRVEYIENILWSGGIRTEHEKTGEPAVWDGLYQQRADKLGIAVRKLIRDSLVLDQVFITREGSEKIGGERKHPVMYWKVEDAALMRRVDSEVYVPRIRQDLNGLVKYIMMDPSASRWNIMREYRWDEGDMFHRNPRTEWMSHGYGKSELEQALDVILGVLYGMNANKEWFTDSHIPMGILNLVGQYGPNEVQALRLRLKQEVGMPGRYYEFPIIATPPGTGSGAQWLPFVDRTRMDMNFERWMTFCVAVAAAIFQIAPEEFGFASFGGPSSTLQEPDPESTFEQSQHRGLIPKVLWVAETLDAAVVQPIDEDFTIRVQGVDQSFLMQDTAQAQLDQSRLVNGWTINDVQAANDLPPKFDPIDEELWASVVEEFEPKWFENETLRQKGRIDEYKRRGGKAGKCYDAPVSNAGAMEVWMQEHMAEQQGVQDGMNQMAQGEQQNQQQGENEERSAAREQMGALAQRNDERGAEQEAADQQDNNQGMVRVPGVDDAGQLRKALALPPRRRVLRLGPRDG